MEASKKQSESEPRETKKASGPQTGEVKTPPDAGAKGLKEQLLRLRADFENTKKRLERDKSEAIRFANEQLVAEILPVIDNLERAMESMEQGHDPKQVKQGLALVHTEIEKLLTHHGVQAVPSVGKPFDPELHEAVGVVETSDAKDGTVVQELQKGYLLNGRLVRPSKVRISQEKKEP